MLEYETEKSFIWLVETWLNAMGGHHLTSIITDQDGAITGAIAKIFPNTRHHFCLWHIYKNATKNLTHVFKEGSNFAADFSESIFLKGTVD